jgi:hypothetical protein
VYKTKFFVYNCLPPQDACVQDILHGNLFPQKSIFSKSKSVTVNWLTNYSFTNRCSLRCLHMLLLVLADSIFHLQHQQIGYTFLSDTSDMSRLLLWRSGVFSKIIYNKLIFAGINMAAFMTKSLFLITVYQKIVSFSCPTNFKVVGNVFSVCFICSLCYVRII